MNAVEHLLEVRNVIGEGPVWHSQEESLYWVNFIEQFQILRFAPQTGRLDIYETGMPVMTLGLCQKGGMVAATARGMPGGVSKGGQIVIRCRIVLASDSTTRP
jgi:sugar lactone lactonase YvrE